MRIAKPYGKSLMMLNDSRRRDDTGIYSEDDQINDSQLVFCLLILFVS